MTDLSPLRVVVGNHHPIEGVGCAMNVVSWINGDTDITDYPPCSAQPLAVLVQCLNDNYGLRDNATTHEGMMFLSPEHSLRVIELGCATMGTADASRELMSAWLSCVLGSLNGHQRVRMDAVLRRFGRPLASFDVHDVVKLMQSWAHRVPCYELDPLVESFIAKWRHLQKLAPASPPSGAELARALEEIAG